MGVDDAVGLGLGVGIGVLVFDAVGVTEGLGVLDRDGVGVMLGIGVCAIPGNNLVLIRLRMPRPEKNNKTRTPTIKVALITLFCT